MKKKLTFIMILAVLALTSCSDFLDKVPPNTVWTRIGSDQ